MLEVQSGCRWDMGIRRGAGVATTVSQSEGGGEEERRERGEDIFHGG